MDMTEPVIAETVTQIDIDQRVYDLYDQYCHGKSLENRSAVEAAGISVERISGPVLLISGEDDRLWPSPIGLPATANTILHPLRGRAMALGGTPAGNAAAAADSWPRVLQFLRIALPAR